MSSTLQDITLVVNVTVTGTAGPNNTLNVSGAYTMASCVPAGTSGGPVVAGNGDIDLQCMAGGPGFTNGTDIYFVLNGTVTDGTNSYPVFFAHPGSKAVTITPNCGFKPSLPGSGDTSMLLIDDLDETSEQYSYTLHVLAYIDPKKPSTGSLDPSIVNRGPSKP